MFGSSGKAGEQKAHGSIPLRLSSLFKSCGLWTLSCDLVIRVNETLKWLTLLPSLMQNHSGGDGVASGIVSLPFPPLPGISVPASTSSEATGR